MVVAEIRGIFELGLQRGLTEDVLGFFRRASGGEMRTEWELGSRERRLVGHWLRNPFGGMKGASAQERKDQGTGPVPKWDRNLRLHLQEVLKPLSEHYLSAAGGPGGVPAVLEKMFDEAGLRKNGLPAVVEPESGKELEPVLEGEVVRGGAVEKPLKNRSKEPTRDEVFENLRRIIEKLEPLLEGHPSEQVRLLALSLFGKVNEQLARGAGANKPVDEEEEDVLVVICPERGESIEEFAKRKGWQIAPEGSVRNDIGAHY